MSRLLWILALAVCTLAARAADQPAPDELAQGLKLLDESDALADDNPAQAATRALEAAALLEHARTTNGLENAPLNHAIGNAYFRAGELGRAILAYNRALDLDPTNRQVRQTLEHARATVAAQAPPATTHRVVRWLLRWRGFVPRWSLWWGATALFFLGWVLLAARVLGAPQRLAPTGVAAIALACVGFAAVGLDGYTRPHQRAGVVLEPDTIARTGPSARVYTPAFQAPLAPGTEFVALDERDGWTQIQLASNALGWVPSDRIALVHTNP